MGFYFDEFENDKKQHINLSETAWYIIEQDIKNFYLDETSESKSGFLNTVLANYYEEADASVNIRYMNKTEELEKLFSSVEFKDIDVKTKEKLISSLSESYKKELVNKAFNYPKGHGEKFRINVKNVELLKNDVSEDENYDDSIGLYLKAIYEEYCLLQTYEREQVFFKENVDEINKAIAATKKLKITIYQKHNPKNNTSYNRKFYVAPYKIVQDTTKSYNYLVGIAEEIFDDNTIGEKRISSFRISRMDKIMMCKSMRGFLSQEKKDNIEHELMSKLPQFMAGDLMDIKIRFTKKGYENFNRLLYLRPNNYTKVDNEELTYIFRCTEVQAMNYFLKFVRDVEVLEPKYLRDKFINRYKDALAVYEEK